MHECYHVAKMEIAPREMTLWLAQWSWHMRDPTKSSQCVRASQSQGQGQDRAAK